MKHILLILGSSRQGRNGESVARWVQETLNTIKPVGLSFDFVDLRDENLPFLDSPMPPMTGTYPEGKVQGWAKKIASYDGFVIITPEYNHGYPAVLKNALDLIYAEWNGKPIAFVSYGGASGGIRAVEQLRQVAIELRMYPLRDEVNIPFIWSAFDKNGTLLQPEHHVNALTRVVDGLQEFFKR